MRYGNNGFTLSGPVGWSGANKRLDVAKVENLLGMAGHLDLGVTDGPTGYFGTSRTHLHPVNQNMLVCQEV